MADVELEQVIKVAGNYTFRNGDNYNFQCPICASEGHDRHRDNLIYNANRKIVKCFANESHSLEVLSMINRTCPKPKENNVISKSNIPVWEVRKEQYLEYMRLSQDILLHDKSLLDYVYNKRGITSDILDLCGVGFDDTENCFTIPIFSLKYDCITDFELRKYGDKKEIRRIGGGCSTIAGIYGCKKAKTLIICEGFIDGITLVQWLIDKGQKDFTVYSCSNGVSSLLGVMNEINFKNFDEIKLILDNDEAGNKTTKDIIEKYPFIKDSRQFLVDSDCKDISEYYVKKRRK